MNQKLTLLAVLLVAVTALPAMAQNKGNRTDPDHAQYNIVGTMKYTNGSRYLNDAVGKKITFEPVASRLAEPTDSADLKVRFDSVETQPSGMFIAPNGKMRKLDFWRYDEEVGEWIYDSEVRQGKKEMESTMKTNIMLVIDNSKSLKEDFKKVQDAAIEFVGQLYREQGNRDIFRVGVIGFSTIQFTKTREITNLSYENYKGIIAFIRNLEMENGTALYYSLEKSLDMLEKDAEAIGKNTYKESRIYAFTDGLDQASVDDARGLSTPTKYYEHIRPLMKNKRILNMPKKKVHSTIVTVRGDDMTDGQERLFDQRAAEICDDVRKLTDMSQLTAEFQKLAADLVNSNFILYCYIPVGASGRVGWTFAEETKKPSKFWMGINLAGTYGYFYYETAYGDHYDPYTGEWVMDYSTIYNDILSAYVGMDVAWPLASWFSLGGSLDLGYNIYEDSPSFRLGPLAKFDFKKGSALLLGGGIALDLYAESYGYLNLGYKFKSPWYVDATLYLKNSGYDGGYAFGLGIGYSIFGGRKK